MFVAIDTDQKVSQINTRGCEILGLKESDILGKNWFDTFIPPRTVRQCEKFLKIRFGELSGKETETEGRVLTQNGGIRIISWKNARRIDAGDHVAGTVSSGEDITDRKQAFQDLQAQ